MKVFFSYLFAIAIACSVILPIKGFAQPNRYNEHWMFGNYAGVCFNGINMGAILGSAMASPQGVATISDNGNGKLVFYSNGQRIWGFDHQIIQNGDQLMGDANSTQAVLFVPWPKDSRYVYAFTTDAEGGPAGLKYSVLDRNAGTNGAVEPGRKNISLASPVTEKLALLRHCDMQSYWVVAHEWDSNKFYAWHITDVELEVTPVETTTGPVYSGAVENGMGYMKPSPKDDMLALAVTGSNRVDIYHFNSLTGSPEFAFSIDNLFQPYGIEFSHDQSMMYVSCLDGPIYQFNMQAANIAASKTLIANANQLTGALQRGVDNRIYITRDLDQFLGYISYPASFGSSCNYVQDGIFLSGRLSEAGLPPYIPVLEHHHISNFSICLGDTIFYDPPFLQKADSFVFYFGDHLSGVFDSVTHIPVEYIFTTTGIHKVELIYYMCGEKFTLEAMICVQEAPGLYLGEDTAICSNTTYFLQGILSGVYCPTIQNNFLWNTGHTSQSITITPPGQFILTVTNACGSGTDTIHIAALPVPSISLGPDIELCAGDTAVIKPFPIPDTLYWEDGSTDSIRHITVSGCYMATAINEFNCMASDDITVNFIDPPSVNWLLQDTVICIGYPMELNAGSGFDSYLWQDGSTGTIFLVTDSGWYHVSVTNKCGMGADSMHVTLEDCRLKLFVPNAFTPNGDGQNDIFKAYGLYIEDFSMIIYNRMGEQAFYTHDIEKGWDGRFRGVVAPEGTYAWKIIYLDATGKYHQLRGTVILLR